jgi:hypothetical protein
MTAIRVELPLALPSTANLREHWGDKAKRVKAQRAAVTLAFRDASVRVGLRMVAAEMSKGAKAVVTLTRVAPRKLDDDNLASACKGVRDSVAEAIGIDDGSPRIGWHYRQERGPVALRVTVEAAP